MAGKTDKPKKQRRRARFERKPELQSLFDRLNLFPDLENWKEFQNVNNGIQINRHQGGGFEPTIDSYKESIENGLELLKSLKEPARKMICPDRELEKASMLYEQRKLLGKLIDLSKATGLATNSNEDYERKLYNNYKAHSLLARSWLFLYNLVKTQKDVLSKLVFIGRNPTSAKKDLTDLLFFQSIGLFYNFHIDENNIFQIQDNGFLDALVGVDVTRIRQCVICRKFFWANRIDKKSCREKCANTLNQRLSREHKRQKGSQYYEASQVKHKKKSQKD